MSDEKSETCICADCQKDIPEHLSVVYCKGTPFEFVVCDRCYMREEMIKEMEQFDR